MSVIFRIFNVVQITSFAMHHYAVCRSFIVCVSGFVIVIVIVVETIVTVGVVVMGRALS